MVAQGPPAAVASLHGAGVEAPFSLHPVRVLGRPSPRVAEALGLVLEKRGMSDLTVAPVAFEVGDAEWSQVPALFGRHVQQAAAADGTKRYHLYAEFLGTPRTGPTEVRFVVVDSAGQLVIVDRQTPTDADFRRTAGRDPDPLGCATLVAERLFGLADWQKRAGTGPDGKFAERWRNLSGSADSAEQQAMQKRRQVLREHLAGARLVVLPTRVNAQSDADSGQRLAASLSQRLACRATAAASQPIAVAPDSNEQKVLWDLARGLGAEVRKNPIDAAYALVVDIGMHAGQGVGFVHVVLCTAAGEPVLAEFQNDQHSGLRHAAPLTLEQTEQFVVDWLAELLQ